MTPEEEQEAVRRALAATPPPGPMPPEVVARLEATIADLAAVHAAEQAPPRPADATVTALEERRRRRWPRVLVAAASVVLVGYGVGVVVQDAGQHAETAASDSAAGGAGDEDEAESGADRGAAGGSAAEEVEPPGALGAPEQATDGRVVRLSAATLRRDVVRHLERQRAAVTADGLTELDAKRHASRDGTCTLPDVGDGDHVAAARLDGRRATLVVRAAAAGTRVAEVYWCGDGRTLLAETEVPARR